MGRVILTLERLNVIEMNRIARIILQNAMSPNSLTDILEVIMEKKMIAKLV